jgi:chromosome segregation ATPase
VSGDDLTREIPAGDRLDQLISLVHTVVARLDTLEQRFGSLEQRLDALEQKVDERLHDTRPIWEAVQNQMAELLANFRKFDRKFDVLQEDFIEMKYKQRELESRVKRIEEKAS